MQQKTIAFSKGLTTIPSDMVSDDTELVSSSGIIFRNSEMHPVQSPVLIGTVQGKKAVYTHRGNGFTNIIFSDDNGTIDAYRYENGALSLIGSYTYQGKYKCISSVADTLIVGTDEGLAYFRFRSSKYIAMGNSLPIPDIYVWMGTPTDFQTDTDYKPVSVEDYVDRTVCNVWWDENNDLCKIEEPSVDDNGKITVSEKTVTSNTPRRQSSYSAFTVKKDRQAEFNNAMQAAAAHAIALSKKSKCFAFPFFVRYALRLFDGSYARISNPILCYPSVRMNGAVFDKSQMVSHESYPYYTISLYQYISDLHSSELYFKASIPDMENWNDIITDIVFFASDEVMPYTLDSGWKYIHPTDMMKQSVYDGIILASYDSYKFTFKYKGTHGIYIVTDGPLTSAAVPQKMLTDDQIMEKLLGKTVFYKLFEVHADDAVLDGHNHATANLIQDATVENLTEQEQLVKDDYYGWAKTVPDSMFTYNSRVNLFGVLRYPFNGFGVFSAIAPSDINEDMFSYYVHIVSSTMDTWVHSDRRYSSRMVADSWFFYPDTNATEAIVVDYTLHAVKLKLKKHPRLNGAYAFLSLPDGTSADMDEMDFPHTDETAHEVLGNQIFTSVVNNPFVFEASGNNTIGSGEILGIAANTEPVSQGQFGQYPLLVFTTDGIYAMSVNSEGLYSASHPISREVCNNPESITPTGSLVFFSSNRGLMATTGSSVACVSAQLCGKIPHNFNDIGNGDFITFLKNSIIAYDYKNALLHIFSKKEKHKYIYAIESKTFAMDKTDNAALSIVNVYPDSIMQDTQYNVFSVTNIPNANEDRTLYNGSFTSRPLKLGSSLQLKTIHQITHLFDSYKGTISLRIFGSNDCKVWNEIKSLHGKPWKYYTFKYEFRNFLACDTFAGSVISFMPRFTNKMR